MKKQKHSRNIDLIREGIKLAYGPAGEREAQVITNQPNGKVRKFFQKHKEVLAGPLQSAIEKHYHDLRKSTLTTK